MFLIAKYSPGKFSFNLGVPDIYSTVEVTNKSSIASCLVNLRAVKTYSVNEVTDKNCRSNPFRNFHDRRERIEAECLFPFTLSGKNHSTCIQFELTNFTRPVFRCPIRTVKGAGPNGTDYTDYHLTGGELKLGEFCPTNRCLFKLDKTQNVIM